MKNVLVSGASTIVGYGILRSLRRAGLGLNLIGTTIYEDSVAQGFCDVFEMAPPTSAPGYISWLCEIVKRHKVDLLIPGIDADMYMWNEFRSEIEKTGATLALNRRELIDLCSDKWLFYEELKKCNSPYLIESTLTLDYQYLIKQFGLPFLMKPRKGFGSKGVVRINNESEFLSYKQSPGISLLAQPIVGNDDEEFTTSAFCDGTGGFYCCMTLKRKLSKDGFTEKAEVVELEGVHEALNSLSGRFFPLGPTNFQFRLHKGKLMLLEINPRVSSSTSIRASFGYNESMMAVNYFIDKKQPYQPVIKKGRAVRYIEDFVFYE